MLLQNQVLHNKFLQLHQLYITGHHSFTEFLIEIEVSLNNDFFKENIDITKEYLKEECDLCNIKYRKNASLRSLCVRLFVQFGINYMTDEYIGIYNYIM